MCVAAEVLILNPSSERGDARLHAARSVFCVMTATTWSVDLINYGCLSCLWAGNDMTLRVAALNDSEARSERDLAMIHRLRKFMTLMTDSSGIPCSPMHGKGFVASRRIHRCHLGVAVNMVKIPILPTVPLDSRGRDEGCRLDLTHVARSKREGMGASSTTTVIFKLWCYPRCGSWDLGHRKRRYANTMAARHWIAIYKHRGLLSLSHSGCKTCGRSLSWNARGNLILQMTGRLR